jgi:large subunit ribosomal protein L12
LRRRHKSEGGENENMEYIYAALLLHDSGKEVTEDKIKAIIEAAGVKVDKGRVKALVTALNDVNIDEAISQAQVQPAYATIPTATETATTVEAGETTAPQPAEVEKKKEEEEKKKKEEEEEAEETGMEGLASLFG